MRNDRPSPLMSFLEACGVRPHEVLGFEGKGLVVQSKSNPAVSVGFVAGKPNDAVVHFFDQNSRGFSVHFQDGEPDRIVVGNLGRSGEVAYNTSADILAKLAKAAQTKPTTSFPGVFIGALTSVLQIPGFGPHNSSSDTRTSDPEGARNAIGQIQEKLSQTVGVKPRAFPQRVGAKKMAARLGM